MAARRVQPRSNVDWRAGPIRDPRLSIGRLPQSWADGRFEPPHGDVCVACRGTQFWALPGERGWCCASCHPPADPTGLRFVSTARKP